MLNFLRRRAPKPPPAPLPPPEYLEISLHDDEPGDDRANETRYLGYNRKKVWFDDPAWVKDGNVWTIFRWVPFDPLMAGVVVITHFVAKIPGDRSWVAKLNRPFTCSRVLTPQVGLDLTINWLT